MSLHWVDIGCLQRQKFKVRVKMIGHATIFCVEIVSKSYLINPMIIKFLMPDLHLNPLSKDNLTPRNLGHFDTKKASRTIRHHKDKIGQLDTIITKRNKNYKFDFSEVVLRNKIIRNISQVKSYL